MISQPPRSYILCATPRSGSTYLCSLLASSGVAGVPESYFRAQDLARWAKGWGVSCPLGHPDFYPHYVQAVQHAGRTPNGVFAMRVMWGTMAEIEAALAPLCVSGTVDERAVLDQAFGHPRYVYLERRDHVAQAVSRLKAEQTDIWHVETGTQHFSPPDHDMGPVTGDEDRYAYDHQRLEGYVREAGLHNQAWCRWFDHQGITPLRIVYETLCAEPAQTIEAIFEYLGIPAQTAKPVASRNQKMADGLSAAWIERFNSRR